MSDGPKRTDDLVSRRNFLVSSAAIGAAGLAGCTSSNGDGSSGDGSSGSDSTPTETSSSDGGSGSSGGMDLLTAGGSSTVYPITNRAASHWNYNPPADDAEYWPHGDYGIDTQMHMADYWAGQFDIETNDDSSPPYRVSIGLSHSGVGLRKVMEGQVDIGDASAPVEAELPDVDHDPFKNHVVGIDGMQIIVSQAIYDAGIDQLTKQQVVDIYEGNTENWSELGGPDREIQCVGRVEGSGTRTIFHLNMLGSGGAEAPGVDVHKGENQQVASTVRNSNNAIGYVGIAFVGNGAPAVDLKIGDTVYSPANNNLGSTDYPLNRDLHCYTYEGTSKYEAAFINMIVSDLGQDMFVAYNDYIKLTDSRQQHQQELLQQ
ncbi:MAG: PstS family phosphate ABC transporter substrate-binding protein [Haloarculaceae archaeon]